MGYDYGFHLVLVKPPKAVAQEAVIWVEGDQAAVCPIDIYAKTVADFCIEYAEKQDWEKQGFWFPGFGKKFHAGSQSYSCGNHDNGLQKVMAVIGNQFPEASFALHHYYWDMTNLTIYSFQGDKIFTEAVVDFENYNAGPYKICIHIDFMRVAMPGNMTPFFNKKYGYEFDFSYEAIFEAAGLPVPPSKQQMYPFVTVSPGEPVPLPVTFDPEIVKNAKVFE
jgi:hypothetical protein